MSGGGLLVGKKFFLFWELLFNFVARIVVRNNSFDLITDTYNEIT